MRGAAPLLSFTGRSRGDKCAFSRNNNFKCSHFYLKMKENFEYWNTLVCADLASEDALSKFLPPCPLFFFLVVYVEERLWWPIQRPNIGGKKKASS